MARAGRTFRVFVSSTFSDLKAERDALQRHVFPRLRELCMQHGARFQAIDLRWGVSEEAGLDQQTMNLCLREVRRCREVTPRPNFIVLLGDRYGWRPLPPQIPADEFELLAGLVTEPEEQALLQQWYRRDDNAVPPEYVLQPRTGEQTDAEAWSQTETALRTVFARALAARGWAADDPRRVKYEASATEQEILAGALSDETETDHAFCYFRTLTDMPSDASVAAVFRETHPEAAHRLEAIKHRLREHFPAEQVCEYGARWSGDALGEDHLPALCERVATDLKRAIVAELAYIERQSPLQLEVDAHRAFSEDRARHFIGRHDLIEQIGAYLDGEAAHPLVVYGPSGCGKSALMAHCEQMARRDSSVTVISRFVGATPASGDLRSLLDSLCTELATLVADERPVPTDLQDLAPRFRELLEPPDGDARVTIFVDALDQLVGTYAASAIHWLPRELPPGVHIVVSLLEREDEAGSCLRAAREMLPDEWLVAITPMAPAEGEQALTAWLDDARRTLGAEQKADVLGKFASCPLPLFLKLAFEEARHWKSYDGLPRGGDREPGVGRDIPGVIADLLGRLEAPTGHGQVMVSKSLRSIGAARHGLTEDEVLDVLSADEMVVEDFRLRSPRSPKVNRLPVVVWSRLFHDLEPYLTERMADSASLMAFYHRQVGEAVHGRYLSENSKPPAHQRLARYFLEQASQLDGPDGSQTPNVRRCAELPYQLSLGEMWDELLATLTDYPFLDAKLRGVNVRDLIADYERAGTAQPALPPDEVRSLRLIGDALRLSSHILIRDPDQLPSQLFGRMHDLEDAGAQRLLRETRDVVARPWLRPIKVSFTPPGGALLRTLEGHAHKVCDVALTPDGKRAVSAGGENDGSPGELMTWDLETGQRVHVLEGHTSMVWAVAVTPDGRRVVSRSADDTLRTWDLETGRLLQTLVGDFCGKIAVAKSQSGDRVLVPSSDYGIRVWDLGAGGPHLNLEGHTGDVQTVAVTQDGLRAISGSKDGTLRVWDLQTGEQLQVLESPNGRVDAVSVTPDGKRALSGAWDCVVPCLWDVETGQLLRTLESEPASGSCVAVTPDGLRALSGRDDTLRIWDLESGRELATLQEGIWHISALAVTPDSKWAVSGSWDGRLRVWDLDSQPGVPPIRKHSAFVKALSVTPDGRRAVSGATGEGAPAGNSLLVWDLDAGKVVAAPEHLTESVNAIALTPDGRRAVVGLDRAWGTREDTLRTYDLETADELPTSGTYTAWTNGVIVTPDGKLALPVSRGPLVVWDIEDGRECGRLARSGTGGVWAVAISPDGERVVCAETGSTLRVWDLATRQELFALIAHTRQIDQVGVTPDGRQVVSASNTDTRIKVWDMPARAEVHALNDHVGWVRAMAVAPDGRWAVSAAGRLHRPYELKLWDLATGSELRVFSGHADLVEALVVTPDGLRAVSASWDGTLRVWDVTTGEALCVLIAEHGLSRCAVSPDGLTVIAGDHQGYVHFLRLENVTPGPPVCTAWHSPGATFPAFGCLHCRAWSEVSEENLGTELPCPSCGKTVKLNEFVIEADWRPIAAAWKPEE